MTLHRPEDQLWIVTDGALRDPGIGATLYVTRGDKSHVSVQRVHYWPTPSFGWPFDRSSHTTQPPILSPVEDGRQMLSIRYRSGQGHLMVSHGIYRYVTKHLKLLHTNSVN